VLEIKKYSNQAATDQALAEHIAEFVDRADTAIVLLSGGSAIATEINALNSLSEESRQKTILAQTDERYGPYGHQDSNWTQLIDQGLRLDGLLETLPVLSGDETAEQLARAYAEKLSATVKSGAAMMGIYGIGLDGHTAGMLPADEEAFSRFLSESICVSYVGSDFERITTTATIIPALSEAVVLVRGKAKLAVVEQVASSNQPAHVQPAQLLKHAKHVTVYYTEEG
jgi:6-phosphogluconolactonase/glucosamine-6-phosphate isomerase/deaminase